MAPATRLYQATEHVPARSPPAGLDGRCALPVTARQTESSPSYPSFQPRFTGVPL